MERFKIKADGFKDIKKQMLVRAIPISLIAVAVGLGISFSSSGNQGDDINVLPIVIPIALIALAIGIFRGANRQKQWFNSYCLIISESGITREQRNTPTISISYTDINEITKSSNGSFIIKGRNSGDVIFVPVQMENYEHLEETLNQIREVKAASAQPPPGKRILPVTLLVLGTAYYGYVNRRNRVIWSDNEKLLKEKLKMDIDDDDVQ